MAYERRTIVLLSNRGFIFGTPKYLISAIFAKQRRADAIPFVYVLLARARAQARVPMCALAKYSPVADLFHPK